MMFGRVFVAVVFAASWSAALGGCENGEEGAAAGPLPESAGSAWDPPSLDHLYALLRASEYDSLDILLPARLTEVRQAGDSVAVGRILTVESYVAYRRGDLGEARRLGEVALTHLTESELDREVFRTYNLLGLVAYAESRLFDALDFYQRTLEMAPEGQGDRTRAVVSVNRGLVSMDLGAFSRAQEEFERARDLARLVADPRLEGIALNNLGAVRIWAGDPPGAISVLEAGLALFRKVGFIDGELNALGQIGTAHTALGDIGRGRDVLSTAVERARAEGLKSEEASSLEALAEVYRLSGDFRSALDLYEQAGRLYAAGGFVAELGTGLRSRAEILATLGDSALARDLAVQALDTHSEVDARWEALGDLLLLADLEHSLGDLTGQLEHLRVARTLVEEIDAPSARIELAVAEARIALRSDSVDHALEVLDSVSSHVAGSGYEIRSEWEMLRAQALSVLARPFEAERAARSAVDAAEAVRSTVDDPRLKATYGSRRLEAYRTLVDVLLGRGAVAEAFPVSDAARGGWILEGHGLPLGEGSDQAGSPMDRAELLWREIGAMSQAVWGLNSVPAEEQNEATLSELRDSMEQSLGDLIRIREGVFREEPARTILGLGHPLSTEETQRALDVSEALIEYLIGPDRTLGFFLTRDTIVRFEVPVSEPELTRRVRIAHELSGRAEWDSAVGDRVLGSLHETLLGPVAEAIGSADRLVFVPHGVLNYLPFAALLKQTTGRYLVQDHIVQLAPSGAFLAALRSQDRTEGEPPVSGLAFAPQSRSLPATGDEARAIAAAIPSMRSVVGRRATEARLRASLGRDEIVHLATHAELNPRNPLFSRMLMAGGQGRNPADDGQFEVREILDLDIRSPLIVLSGCQTGVGTSFSTGFVRGDDYAALGQAFLYGGARNVVATLWRVEDQASADLAAAFYAALAIHDPVRALAEAQRRLIGDLQRRAPFYWAGYQLSGSGRIR